MLTRLTTDNLLTRSTKRVCLFNNGRLNKRLRISEPFIKVRACPDSINWQVRTLHTIRMPYNIITYASAAYIKFKFSRPHSFIDHVILILERGIRSFFILYALLCIIYFIFRGSEEATFPNPGIETLYACVSAGDCSSWMHAYECPMSILWEFHAQTGQEMAYCSINIGISFILRMCVFPLSFRIYELILAKEPGPKFLRLSRFFLDDRKVKLW